MARIVALFAVFALATAMTSLTAIKTNTCFGTGVAITTPAECKSAVAINTATEWLEPTTNMLNKLEQGGWPKGCICRYPDLACYFNTNSDNGIRDDYGVLCTVASAPTAAPTFSVATLTDNSASSPPPFTNKYDNYRKVANAGTHGGVCTCPNGKTYEVGDNKNNCGSIACEGGSAGPCSSGGISHLGYGMKVTCGVDCPAFSSTAATNVMATASSTLNGDIPSKAVDGNTATIMHTHGSTAHPWLQLDLGSSKRISEVKIWNRQSTWDSILQRLGHHQIWVGDSSVAPGGAGDTGKMCFDGTATTTVGPFNEACSATGQYVRIVQLAYNIMHLAEVEVYINDIQNTDAAAQCTYCPLGQFKNAADSGCTQCAAGKYSAATDATSSNTCVDCEQGKYSAAGATACTSAFKLAHDQYVINTKASLTAAEPLYKKAVSLFGSTTGTDSFLTRGAKRRYNNLLAHDSRKNTSEQAFACEDSCNAYSDVAFCTANYCNAYKVGASLRNRCAPGAVGHNFALLECQKTCGICVAKTPFANHQLSFNKTLNHDLCSDGKRNGDETGVDCGGSCACCGVDCVYSETTCTCTPACGNTCKCTDNITITTPAAGCGKACPGGTNRNFTGAACPPAAVKLCSDGTVSAGSSATCMASMARPIDVHWEMKSTSNSECLSANFFGNDGKNSGVSYELGGWSNKARFFPDDWQKVTGSVTEWSKCRLSISDIGVVKFWLDDSLLYTTDTALTSGTMRFHGGCIPMAYRNVIGMQ